MHICPLKCGGEYWKLEKYPFKVHLEIKKNVINLQLFAS